MSRTGAELIIHSLERHGVRAVAGIPGGALLPLYEALGRSSRLRHVLARHEQGAGFIAQGMARVTGQAGVCFATSGPGVTNMVTAIADAKLDSIPLICIAGQVPTHLIGSDAFQEVATIDICKSITKASFFVRNAADLPRIIAAAFVLAEQGRPGPVLIDVPKDVQMQRVSEADLEANASDPVSTAPSTTAANHAAYDRAAYDRAAALLAAAQRPVLYVGGGVTKTRAHELLRALAERADIPVTTTLMALGALPTDHPLNLGMLGMHAARYTNLVLDECDLLIAIGARFDDRATGRSSDFVRNANIIHIDIDPRELGKIKQPTLAMVADAKNSLQEMIARVLPQRRPAWRARVAQLRSAYPLHMPLLHDICSPYGIVRAVGELAPHDAIITTDVGQHQMWVAQAYPFSRPDRLLTSGGLGTMGFGLPAAIGAALAEPEATVICFTGDGSLLMNIQELATLAELKLRVKIILLDNAALGLVRQQQTLFYQQRHVACEFACASQFVAIAQAFGIAGVDLGLSSAPRAALAQAMHIPEPTLVRVPIAMTHQVLPMVAPGAANADAVDHEVAVLR